MKKLLCMLFAIVCLVGSVRIAFACDQYIPPCPTIPPCPVTVDAKNDCYSVRMNHELNVTYLGLRSNDIYPKDKGTATVTLLTGPSHDKSFSLSSNGGFSYMPAYNYHGSDSFTYTLTWTWNHYVNGKLVTEKATDTATVTITVRCY